MLRKTRAKFSSFLYTELIFYLKNHILIIYNIILIHQTKN